MASNARPSGTHMSQTIKSSSISWRGIRYPKDSALWLEWCAHGNPGRLHKIGGELKLATSKDTRVPANRHAVRIYQDCFFFHAVFQCAEIGSRPQPVIVNARNRDTLVQQRAVNGKIVVAEGQVKESWLVSRPMGFLT